MVKDLPIKMADPAKLLPLELMAKIFSYIDHRTLVSVSVVSKLWYRICFDGALWSSFDISGYYQRIPSDQIVKVIKHAGNFIHEINLRGCNHLEPHQCKAISESLTNLSFISIEGCTAFDHNALTQLVKKNRGLRHIDFHGVTTLTNATCFTLGSACRHLVSLDVSGCANIDAIGVLDVLKSCSNTISHLLIDGLKGVENENFMSALHGCHNLKVLNMRSCTTLTDESVRIFVHNSTLPIAKNPVTNRPNATPRKLRRLCLSECILLTSAAIINLAHVVPELCELEVAGIPALFDDAFGELIPTTPNLMFLDCENCTNLTDDTITTICESQCWKVFKHGQFSFCENFSDEGVTQLIDSCPMLRNLELDNTRVSDVMVNHAIIITRSRIARLMTRYKELIEKGTILPPSYELFAGVVLRLSVYDCPHVTWESLLAVMRSNSERLIIQIPFESVDILTKDMSRDVINKFIDLPSVDKLCAGTKLYPTGLIDVNCHHSWKQVFDAHVEYVTMGRCDLAVQLEREFSEYITDDPLHKYDDYLNETSGFNAWYRPGFDLQQYYNNCWASSSLSSSSSSSSPIETVLQPLSLRKHLRNRFRNGLLTRIVAAHDMDDMLEIANVQRMLHGRRNNRRASNIQACAIM
ncbi:hypothetical protein V1514DRAFT_323643 [Lipomyces japonicus]|uniref:uncharacterized protein n=1 Tax=Lipomyces japonicus TaxID=56871 RepID=UPI0034CED2E5